MLCAFLPVVLASGGADIASSATLGLRSASDFRLRDTIPAPIPKKLEETCFSAAFTADFPESD